MKAITVIQRRPIERRQSVKKQLIQVIICLTSDKFFIFAATIGCLIGFAGVLIDDEYIFASGTISFLIGFAPWSWRQTRREIRQDRHRIEK